VGAAIGPVDCLIFSRDRAPQLDLLLRSIDRHAAGVYGTVSVLWTCSTLEHARGYASLELGRRDVAWRREDGFEADVRSWLGQAGPAVSFLVDDDVFYRDAPAPARLPWSYRGGDYWYPFSVDGNVYERGWIVHLLEGMRFRDPTQLEALGHERRNRLPFAEVYPCVPPCLVGVPANRVSPSSGMPHMGRDPAELNRRFLAGERLELPALDVGRDLDPHEYLPLVFA
jgi:hypothetical protein